jgi:hypothetical protein
VDKEVIARAGLQSQREREIIIKWKAQKIRTVKETG